MTPGPPEIAWPALAAVGLVSAVALLAHWWLRTRGLATNSTNAIKVLATRPLGPKRALAIVEVEGERFLVGMTDDAISLLSTLRSERRAKATPQPPSFGVAR